MDRLTEYFAGIKGAFPNISANKRVNGGFRPCDEVCASVEGRCENCTVQAVISKLAEYEQTGLTPVEIASLRADKDQLEQHTKGLGDELSRAMSALTMAETEIAALRAELDAFKADIKAGLLIRVPCREFFDGAGGTVWLVWG